MPNNALWLRKIAAFLHDPPDKGYFFGTRDLDCIRYFSWVAGVDQRPFYVAFPSNMSDSNIEGIINCLKNNWTDFANLITQQKIYERPSKQALRNICQNFQISSRTLGRFQSILCGYLLNREFHRVASSQFRLENMGFRPKDELILSIRHPLDPTSFWKLEDISISEYKSEMENQEKKQLRDNVIDFIRNLIQNATDFKERFLILWRTPYRLSLITPPEPILPDNSLFDLETMQSAIAVALDSNLKVNASFLILEFGSVQKFIAKARKARDLWFSSWLISYLSWQAMKPIAEELGPDNIVYPDLYKQPLVDQWLKAEIKLPNFSFDKSRLRLPTLPNTFLAILPEGKEKDYAEKAHEGLKNTWKDIKSEVLDLIEHKLDKNKSDFESFQCKFKDQTKKPPFNIYWLGLKWGDDPEKALEDYKKLLDPHQCWEFERLWNQMKSKVTPNIGDTYSLIVEMIQSGLKALKYRGKPEVIEEPWQKCTLCGERTALVDIDLEKLEKDGDYVESLLEKCDYEDLKNKEFAEKRNNLYFRRLKDFWKNLSDTFPGHIKENEHLCGVCLVKRLAPKVIWKHPEKFFPSISYDYKFDFHYPSTGSIALTPFLRHLLDIESIRDQIRKLHQKLLRIPRSFADAHFTEGRTVPAIGRILPLDSWFEGDFEPEWFYDESFLRFEAELEYKMKIDPKNQDEYKSQINWIKTIQQAVDEVKQKVREKLGDEKFKLPKYYAAVYLDGDDLGKWIRGDNAPKIEEIFHPDFVKEVANDPDFVKIKDFKRPVTPAIHRAISGALRDFALEVVPYVVESNLGVVAYSGGDDTLFLMPLENLLETLLALRKLYSGEQYVFEAENRRFESNKGFIKIYENGNLKEIIRVMGTRATLSAGVAIAHYLYPLDIVLGKAKEMLEKAKTVEGKNRVGFKVIVHSGSEREAVIPWKFVESMKTFQKAISEGLSSRFIHQLYSERQTYDEIPDAFDAEFLRFGKRGTGEAFKNTLCRLVSQRKQEEKGFSLTPSKFMEALLISEFLVREEG